MVINLKKYDHIKGVRVGASLYHFCSYWKKEELLSGHYFFLGITPYLEVSLNCKYTLLSIVSIAITYHYIIKIFVILFFTILEFIGYK